MFSSKVLVVDDSSSVRQQLRIALSQAGYEIVEAENGLEGALLIEQDQHLDVVICDISMPVLDGIGMLDRVGAVLIERRLPVLMLTTSRDPNQLSVARALGASAWVVKPFRADLLLKAVDALVERRRVALSA